MAEKLTREEIERHAAAGQDLSLYHREVDRADFEGIDPVYLIKHFNCSFYRPDLINLTDGVTLRDLGFQETPSGFLAYKTFGAWYKAPKSWKKRAGSIITSDVLEEQRILSCGQGINLGTMKYVRYGGKPGKSRPIYVCLVPWHAKVVIPHIYEGKFRTNICRIIGKIEGVPQ